MVEKNSFCRICPGFCGMVLTVEDDRIVAIRGDRDDPHSRGFACIKGLQAPAAHHGEQRLLQPLKRMPDGSFRQIPLDDAIAEIGARLADIVERDGPEALAAFRGTVNVFSGVSGQMVPDFLAAFGSRGFYSTMTIDQSAKWVTIERLGMWSGGGQSFDDADVWLWAGINPVVSLSGVTNNPVLAMKEARKRGQKVIVIDPRRTETASFADIHLQPRPGHDAAIAAGLLRVILTEGWIDADFCAAHVAGLDALRAAVLPFEPEFVAARAGIAAGDLRAAAAMFARDGRRGMACAGTGVAMSPHCNLADHLYQCLNVVCGRFLRAGEVIPNPGVIGRKWPIHADVMGPFRSYERAERGRIGGHGMLFGEKMTAMLADEITTPGAGRVRALVVDGGNPASAVPDHLKFVAALRDLELLVTIDPYMSATARLAHYVLPPKVFFEHADVVTPTYETAIFARPYVAYTDAVVAPPPGSDVDDDWMILWRIARAAGRTVRFNGVELDPHVPPTADQLHAIMLQGGRLSLEQVRAMAGTDPGIEPVIVGEDRGMGGRFAVAPDDVISELAEVANEPPVAAQFTHRLISRRLREVSNSMYQDLPAIRRRVPYNAAYMHPDDLAAHGLADGDRITIISDHGRMPGIVAPDATVRAGCISMAHNWGGLPGEGDCAAIGANTGLLISTARDLQPINAMPRQSAIPVRIEPAGTMVG